MSLQKDNKITRQVQEWHTEGENSSWTLESPKTTLRMESQSASTTTSMGTWQRNASQRRKNEKQGNVSNVTKKGT